MKFNRRLLYIFDHRLGSEATSAVHQASTETAPHFRSQPTTTEDEDRFQATVVASFHTFTKRQEIGLVTLTTTPHKNPPVQLHGLEDGQLRRREGNSRLHDT